MKTIITIIYNNFKKKLKYIYLKIRITTFLEKSNNSLFLFKEHSINNSTYKLKQNHENAFKIMKKWSKNVQLFLRDRWWTLRSVGYYLPWGTSGTLHSSDQNQSVLPLYVMRTYRPAKQKIKQSRYSQLVTIWLLTIDPSFLSQKPHSNWLMININFNNSELILRDHESKWSLKIHM